jgi:hypothetical protein
VVFGARFVRVHAENGKHDKERAVSGGFFGLLESFFDRPFFDRSHLFIVSPVEVCGLKPLRI